MKNKQALVDEFSELLKFLAPTGAQEKLMSVCLSGTNLSRAINLLNRLTASSSYQRAFKGSSSISSLQEQ